MSEMNTLMANFVKANTKTSSLLNGMKATTNYGYTENGGVKHNTTNSAVLDMFGQGGSMRNRSDADVIYMFKRAYEENPTYALKCLFYLRDAREGAGERRFFRVCLKWLAQYDLNAVLRNLEYVPEYGRYDDWFCLFDTPAEKAVLDLIKRQLITDIDAFNTPKAAVSLFAKWAPSINCSSKTTLAYAHKIVDYLGVSPKMYRKTLSALRERIRVLERLMSQNRWEEIDFSKIPSRAGLIYSKSFLRHEEERYRKFMSSKETKVNAQVLTPYDIAHQILNSYNPAQVDRQRWDKYWAGLKDYYCGRQENGIAVIDVSGSMSGRPMEAAVSMGAYIAERGKGPFQNHFITFASNPALVEFSGIDTYDKFRRATRANWGGSTNIEAVFDLLLQTARKYHTPQKDMPQTIYIFSDMEFNGCITSGPSTQEDWWSASQKALDRQGIDTVIEAQMRKWKRYGYKAPRVIFWNLDARHENIPALGDNFSYVSGFSMSMVETILGGKSGYDLMLEKLDSERYKMIH